MNTLLEKAPYPSIPIYVVSFINPLLGIIIGAMWMGKPGKDNREFGLRCIIWGVVGFTWVVLIIGMVFAVYFALVFSFVPMAAMS